MSVTLDSFQSQDGKMARREDGKTASRDLTPIDSFGLSSVPAIELTDQAADDTADFGCSIQYLLPRSWLAKAEINSYQQLCFELA